MAIVDDIRAAMKAAMKAGETERRDHARVVLAEFQRLPTKEVDDARAVKILRALAASEREMLKARGEERSGFLDFVEEFLPRMMDEAEIRAWIEANVDLSAYPNRLQAMRPIMEALSGQADGALVKRVLSGM
ncbi:GatB/YqeY domain-containing protein [Dissulfurirhabdus thermomarina]|uniref:GatB/YqeY domain-containing protein n=1 Tax=Dissulfurirhabdus thermomarina TaxID=1765737 RepID=A0A6N9TMK4_DISTH|nr:GatB/YqeY domain-containing protein [Dissulfurirhabdus thermomarina]NDY42465.1 GatB/YqeY domain-containing protein [Dissulfurirhabdus thermomarina]NMX23853.1 GatB/YqeY domain-containing protein [Dissulfurirhabdus thermomarina]